MADSEAALSGQLPDPGYRERYPWHVEPWASLTRDLTRLPHALLLHGQNGLGKRAFAWRLAQFLLCAGRGTQNEPCNTCASCARFAAGTHPDLLSILPLEESTVIAVDQIRAVRDFVVLKPHTSTRKLVIIEPAEAMNLNAANALLKVLEEPPPSSALLLITPQPRRLPATIRSRCAAVAFRPPETKLALDWLAQQGAAAPQTLLASAAGAPLRALAIARSSELKEQEQVAKDIEALRSGAEEPARCAARWKNYGAARTLEWLQRYIANLIQERMRTDRKSKAVKDLFEFFDVISEAKSVAASPLDEALLLEDILIGWSRISRGIS